MIEITGRVLHGDQYGRKLGFPTANLDRRDFVRKKLKIKLGVYAGVGAVATALGSSKRKWKAGIVIGPMDHRHLPKIEAHLIGFKGNLYGKKITICLGKFIRPFQKFKSELELKQQIKKDIKLIKTS